MLFSSISPTDSNLIGTSSLPCKDDEFVKPLNFIHPAASSSVDVTTPELAQNPAEEPASTIVRSVAEPLEPMTTLPSSTLVAELASAVPPTHPVAFLKDVFARNPYGKKLLGDPATDYPSFHRPTQEATDAYDLSVVQAIRNDDIERLRIMLREGKSFNACNRFGESLIHMVCRRGNIPMATFLIMEACVDVDVRDDFGRSPIHDACWTSKPNVAIMDLLVNSVSPEMLLAEDVRGHTPFDYARKEHYEEWCQYLKSKEADLQRRITTYGSMR